MNARKYLTLKNKEKLRKNMMLKVKIKEVLLWIVIIASLIMLAYFILIFYNTINNKETDKWGAFIFPFYLAGWILFLKLDALDMIRTVGKYNEKFFVMLHMLHFEYNNRNFHKLTYFEKRYIYEITYYIYIYLLKIEKQDDVFFGFEGVEDKQELTDKLKLFFGKNVVKLMMKNEDSGKFVKTILDLHSTILQKGPKRANRNDEKELSEAIDNLQQVINYKLEEIDNVVEENWYEKLSKKIKPQNTFVIKKYISKVFVGAVVGIAVYVLYITFNDEKFSATETWIAMYSIVPSTISMLILVKNWVNGNQ